MFRSLRRPRPAVAVALALATIALAGRARGRDASEQVRLRQAGHRRRDRGLGHRCAARWQRTAPGSGSVEQGQAIYDEKCASCHGTFGESNSYLQIGGRCRYARIAAAGADDRQQAQLCDHSVGLHSPGHAVHQSADARAGRGLRAHGVRVQSQRHRAGRDGARPRILPRVRMPNRDGLTTAHGLMRVEGRPDTANVACMHDCAATIRPSSEIPGYARDSHGDLSQQRREMGAIAGVPTATLAARTPCPPRTASAGLQLARKLGCSACHNVDGTLVGPSFRAVAARYAPQGSAHRHGRHRGRLLVKLKSGGAGAWGTVPMPAQAPGQRGRCTQGCRMDTRRGTIADAVVRWRGRIASGSAIMESGERQMHAQRMDRGRRAA